MPGPGQYDHNANKNLVAGLQFTCRPKTSKDSSFQNFTVGFPGPGTYELKATEDKDGYCGVSKYRSSLYTKMHEAISKNLVGSGRIDMNMMRRSMQIPGPGTYEDSQKLKMDPKGNYNFSKWKGSGAPVFSRSHRNTNLETSATRKSTSVYLLIYNSHPWTRNIPHNV